MKLPNTEIDYHIVDNALNYYSTIGYIPQEVPWVVSREAYEITKPVSSKEISSDRNFVASGEQSFLELVLDGKLLNGMHVCATPCYRPWDPFDSLHRQQFFKVELMSLCLEEPSMASLLALMKDAKRFMERYVFAIDEIESPDEPRLGCKTIVNYDLMKRGIELGSYGIRHSEKIGYWIYGTGVAFPRILMAMEEAYG